MIGVFLNYGSMPCRRKNIIEHGRDEVDVVGKGLHREADEEG